MSRLTRWPTPATTRASKPAPAMREKTRPGPSLPRTRPRQTGRTGPRAMARAICAGTGSKPSSAARTLAVPRGSTARGGQAAGAAAASPTSPLISSLTVPSPPAATTRSQAAGSAWRASSAASPGRVVARRSIGQPKSARAASTASRRRRRRPPAVGLKITKRRRGSAPCRCESAIKLGILAIPPPESTAQGQPRPPGRRGRGGALAA